MCDLKIQVTKEDAEYLLKFAPKHDRDVCSDEKLYYATPCTNYSIPQSNCPRCTLLSIIRNDYEFCAGDIALDLKLIQLQ